MEKKEIIDETFDPNRTETYNLFVKVSSEGFSFSISDTVRNCFISLVTSPFDRILSVDDDLGDFVNQVFIDHEILTHKFKKVFLSFESPLFTIVPSDFFAPEKAKQIFELIHALPDLYEVRYNQIKEINATIIFAVPSSLSSFWLAKQPLTAFVAHAAPLVIADSLSKTAKDEPIVLADFTNKFFINTISVNKELKHCNAYELQCNEEAVYHLINSCKLNFIDPKETTIVIHGNTEGIDSIEKLLSNYFKKVTSDDSFEGSHYSYAVAKFKKSFWGLFNISLCEL